MLEQECNFNMKYIDEIKKAMVLLSQNDKTVFIGQSIKYGGTGLYDTLIGVNDDKKIEWK